MFYQEIDIIKLNTIFVLSFLNISSLEEIFLPVDIVTKVTVKHEYKCSEWGLTMKHIKLPRKINPKM
jgi:hypothetical protein